MQAASPSAIAYHFLPEQHMTGRRLALAHRLLLSHAPAALPAFLFKWGEPLSACELLYPPVPGETASQRTASVASVEEGDAEPLDGRWESGSQRNPSQFLGVETRTCIRTRL